VTLPKCRVCASQQVAPRLQFSGFPCNIWPAESEVGRLFEDLEVHVCESCGHLQLQNLRDSFIRDLYVYESCVLEDPGANRSRLEAFESQFGSGCFLNKRTLDIGGGRNAFSSLLPEGERWICDFGISAELRRPGVEVVEGDFLKVDLPQGHFDYITMFHALEHFNDPAAAVRRMESLLAPGGRILLEVPNVRFVVEAIPHYAVFHQHISMFTSETLEFLFDRHGLSTEHWFNRGEVLFAAFHLEDSAHVEVSLPNPQTGREIVTALESRLEALSSGMTAFRFAADRSQVALYSAGGSSALFLAHFPFLKEKIGVCFDMDPRKQGKLLPGTDIPIHKPESMSQFHLEQVVFLSTDLCNAIGAKLAAQTIDVDRLIRELPVIDVLGDSG
jgi:SAM-dependent methyltransferase